ncbi:MAG: hypothetical protein AAGH57_06265 [Pseudomonadota bacterium]
MEIEVHILAKKSRRVDRFERASALQIQFPENPTANFLVGRRALDLGRNSEATKFFGRSIELAPSDPRAYRYCIEAQRHDGDIDGALETIDALSQIAPLEAVDLKVDCLIEMGREQDAQKLLYEAIKCADAKLIIKFLDLCLALGNEEMWIQHQEAAYKTLSEEQIRTLENRLMQANGKNLPQDSKGSKTSSVEIEYLSRKFGVYTMLHKFMGCDFINTGDMKVFVMEGLSHAVRLYTDFRHLITRSSSSSIQRS